MKDALLAENLRKTYKLPGAAPIRVFDGVSLRVAPGERVAVLGRSGSGKSTLLNILGGLDRPDPGTGARVEVAGLDMLGCGERRRAAMRARNIGFVFQAFHLLPELTVLENVRLPAMAHGGVGRHEAEERARRLLEAAGLGGRLEHRPAELSGGERQRVAVARALLNAPSLLLADEPTGNLDGQTGMQILDLVFDLPSAVSGEAPALVMVTHSREVAARCNRTATLHDGALTFG